MVALQQRLLMVGFFLRPANNSSSEISSDKICPVTDLDKWQLAVQSAQCPGRRHIWQPSCWDPQWSDEGCCGAFSPSHGDQILQNKEEVSMDSSLNEGKYKIVAGLIISEAGNNSMSVRFFKQQFQ